MRGAGGRRGFAISSDRLGLGSCDRVVDVDAAARRRRQEAVCMAASSPIDVFREAKGGSVRQRASWQT